MSWYLQNAKPTDSSWLDKAQDYQNLLTKPPGSLGLLERLAMQFSLWQETLHPEVDVIDIVIMAADHGVAEEGVSAFPQAVTGEMIRNFSRGGAAISVLARQLAAQLTVVNVGTVNALEPMAGVFDQRIAAGCENIAKAPAMTAAQCEKALLAGQEAAIRAHARGAQLFIGGEMGIANTTPAACIAARLLGVTAASVTGPGTGLNREQVQHKVSVVEKALLLHSATEPYEVLCNLGGFEIAALTGAFIACAQLGIPVLLDGYIVTAAAMVAVAINPSVKAWLVASHCSAEPAHVMMLGALGLTPILDLGMRLGEGSGAAVAARVIQSACVLQSEMASFASAGISEKA